MTYSLEFDQVSIGYRRRGKAAAAVVSDASFSLKQGQTLALVGQSGSGKSTLAAAAVGLLARNGEILGGDIRLAGHSVRGKTERQWRELRGSELGYIPQDPLSSLDPVQRIGARLVSDLRLHRRIPENQARDAAEELLDRVGIRDPATKLRSYPHELSGGQLQRILIALAISGNPKLLIADEPTSALDVTVQGTILRLLDDLKEEHGLSVLLITHDLALAADHSNDIAVINQGEIVDQFQVDQLHAAPRHEYTRQLFRDVPVLSPERYATGPRYEQALPTSLESPTREDLDAELQSLTREPAVEISGVHKIYPGASTPVLEDVNLSVRAGEIHALVGESGSGKTTLARILAGLSSFDSGSVRVSGQRLQHRPPPTNPQAQRLQMIYQNALAALNPKMSVQELVEEPLSIHHRLNSAERSRRARKVLTQVALAPELWKRRPDALSGGQRQRAAIARALVNLPGVLVLDEPTSALDVSIQRQIVDLLMELQRAEGLTFLFISHDLSLVRQIADRVTVLDQGRIVETAPTSDLFEDPQQPYTRRLIDALPGKRIRSHAEESRLVRD